MKLIKPIVLSWTRRWNHNLNCKKITWFALTLVCIVAYVVQKHHSSCWEESLGKDCGGGGRRNRFREWRMWDNAFRSLVPGLQFMFCWEPMWLLHWAINFAEHLPVQEHVFQSLLYGQKTIIFKISTQMLYKCFCNSLDKYISFLLLLKAYYWYAIWHDIHTYWLCPLILDFQCEVYP